MADIGFLDDPSVILGLAMLGGQGNFGARALQGIGLLDHQQDSKQQRALRQAQMDNYQSEVEQRKAAMAKQAQISDFVQRLLGAPPAANANPGAVSTPTIAGQPFFSMGSTVGRTAQPTASPGMGGLAGARLEDIVGLHALGGPDLLNAYKFAREGIERKPGSMYEGMNGQVSYTPDPKSGFDFNPATRQVSALPGFIATNSAIEGGKAAGTEGAKAALDPYTYTPPGVDSRPVLTNRLAAMTGTQAMGPTGAASAAAGSRFSPAAWDAASATARNDSDRGLILNTELGSASPADRPAIQREMARGGIPLQSPAEAAKATDTAKADVVRDTSRQLDMKRYGQLTAALSDARDLLKAGPTNSGMGAMVDQLGGFFGYSPDSADAASKLETISGWMTANVPRMEGPQSDKDTMQYKQMAAAVGDRTKPVSQRLAALDSLEKLQAKYAVLNGGGAAPQTPVATLRWNPQTMRTERIQ